MRTLLLVASAFAGGALSAHFAEATPASPNPYGLFDQLARVLVLVENEYVDPTQRAKIVDGAIRGMVAELDPHSAYMPPSEFGVFQSETEGRFAGVGLEVDARADRITIIAPIEGSPAERAGLRAGDEILTIEGKPVRGERLDKLVQQMRGAPGTRVRITIRRGTEPLPIPFELTREVILLKSVTAKRLAHDVAYVRLSQFQAGTHEELVRAAQGLEKKPPRGVVLDMRGNPGGLVDEAEAVADEFLNEGTIYSTRHRGRVLGEVKARGGGAFVSFPVVVLVNESSASAAELVAGALQDNGRAAIVGASTFGKGSVQTIYDLPGGAGLRLTTMRYYTPSGRAIQAEGIRPDVLLEAPSQPGEHVRERDLDGHLEAERDAHEPRVEPRTVVAIPPSPELPSGGRGARSIPDDPSTGSDAALAAAVRELERVIALTSQARR